MEKVANFLEMGGYGAFVWPSLGLTALVMGGLLVVTLQQLHSRQRRLAELEARGTRRARRTPAAAQQNADSAPGEVAR
jgi:heme exporter protein D